MGPFQKSLYQNNLRMKCPHLHFSKSLWAISKSPETTPKTIATIATMPRFFGIEFEPNPFSAKFSLVNSGSIPRYLLS
jgi:hypothetical protein